MDTAMLVLVFEALLILAFLILALFLTFTHSIPSLKEYIPYYKTHIKQQQRKNLLRRKVYQYRLSKMLHYLGIRIEDYVQRIPEMDIKKHILLCKTCPNVITCDQCLYDGKFISDMHFCPNYDTLMAYSSVMPSVESTR